MKQPLKLMAALGLCALVLGCAAPTSIEDEPLVNLGDFKLGHNVIVGDKAEKVPPSREATPEEWEAILGAAVDQRFRQYDGEGLYHFGISVDAYALAVPGVPVVLSPKSILIIKVNVWDNDTKTKLTAEPEQMTIFEGLSGDTFVGSGLTRSREEQMKALSANAARKIERFLERNSVEWFGVSQAEFDAAKAASQSSSNEDDN